MTDQPPPQRARPGPKNDLTDVPGLRVGHAEDHTVRTGVTVIRPDAPMVCAVDVRGGGPGTRETDLLNPATMVQTVDAVVLAGGSTYGLAAADGVTAMLGAQGHGFALIAQEGVPRSPIVPAAILYDLANGGDKVWGETPPYAALGKQAFANAGSSVPLGATGAAFGARAGQEAGGLGSASIVTPDGHTIAALMAVNSFGSVRMPGPAEPAKRAFWAWPFEQQNEFGGIKPPPDLPPIAGLPDDTKLGALAPQMNTTIGVVAVSVPLTQAEAGRVAMMAQDGLARAIRPVHAPTDGDVLFVLAPSPASSSAGGAPPVDMLSPHAAGQSRR